MHMTNENTQKKHWVNLLFVCYCFYLLSRHSGSQVYSTFKGTSLFLLGLKVHRNLTGLLGTGLAMSDSKNNPQVLGTDEHDQQRERKTAIKITIGLSHQFWVVGITDACFMCSPAFRFDMDRTPNSVLHTGHKKMHVVSVLSLLL